MLLLAFIKNIVKIQPVSMERFNFNKTEFLDEKHLIIKKTQPVLLINFHVLFLTRAKDSYMNLS